MSETRPAAQRPHTKQEHDFHGIDMETFNRLHPESFAPRELPSAQMKELKRRLRLPSLLRDRLLS